MIKEEREDVMIALNDAIVAFENSMADAGWDVCMPIKIEAREVRMGDWSLGESIVIDGIKEYLEGRYNEKKE